MRKIPVLVIAVSAGLAVGCSGQAPREDPASHTPATAPSGVNRGVSTAFTLAFARCMRAHGVPRFPDPGGDAGSFQPGGPVDPGSAAFLAAINGPCRALAPAAWVSSGQVSRS